MPSARSTAEAARTEDQAQAHVPPRVYERVRLEVLVQAPLDQPLRTPVEVIVEPAFDDGGSVPARLLREAVLRDAAQGGAVAVFEELIPTAYRVIARAPRLDSVLSLITLDERMPLQRISLMLAPLGGLEGVIHVGEDERLIAAFTPIVLQRVERDLNGELPRLEAQSDGNGRYHFPDLAPGSYDLSVGPAGRPLRTPVRVEIDTAPARQNVGGLPPVGEVSLQAYDEVGKPLANVVFDVVPENSEAKGGGRGRTDAEGVFRLGGLPTGVYLFHAQRDGSHPLQSRFELREIMPVPLVHPVVLRAE